jgi:hypothetical protein
VIGPIDTAQRNIGRMRLESNWWSL